MSVMRSTLHEDFVKFQDAVMDYMEYIGVPPYVESFNAYDVAQSFHGAMREGYMRQLSPRMCGIIIFAQVLHKINTDFVKN